MPLAQPPARSRQLSRSALLLALIALHGAGVVLVDSLSPRLSRARMTQTPEFLWLDLRSPQSPPPSQPPDTRRASGPLARRRSPAAEPLPSPRPDTPMSPQIDWSAEAAAVARHQSENNAAPAPRRLDAVPEHRSLGAPHERPAFGWDEKHIHPTFPVDGGGLGWWLGDRCALILAPRPFMACGVGKKPPARGDLFDHLRAPPADPAP